MKKYTFLLGNSSSSNPPIQAISRKTPYFHPDDLSYQKYHYHVLLQIPLNFYVQVIIRRIGFMLNVMVILLTLSGGLERGPSIGVRGVFLQEGGISQPVAGLLQLCRGRGKCWAIA